VLSSHKLIDDRNDGDERVVEQTMISSNRTDIRIHFRDEKNQANRSQRMIQYIQENRMKKCSIDFSLSFHVNDWNDLPFPYNTNGTLYESENLEIC
jgi:hypothetical protein